MVVWMNEKPLDVGETYVIKRASTVINGTFKKILYKKDVNTFEEPPANKLELNEIGCCELNTDRLLAADAYDKNRHTGSFIIIDRYTNNTLGAGMIKASLQQSGKKQNAGLEAELNAFIRQHFPGWGCKEL
jgi:sulfate adenylyltransferase subunit 1